MSGVGWKVATVAVVQVTRIVVGVILARLLLPRDFGLASMALLFVGVASVFTDLSFGQALIARREISERDRSTAFWTTLAAGAICCGAGVAAAPLVADFDAGRLPPLRGNVDPLLALRLGLEHVGAPAGLRLAAVVLFGAAAYLGLLVWGEPELVREVWTLIRGRGR